MGARGARRASPFRIRQLQRDWADASSALSLLIGVPRPHDLVESRVALRVRRRRVAPVKILEEVPGVRDLLVDDDADGDGHTGRPLFPPPLDLGAHLVEPAAVLLEERSPNRRRGQAKSGELELELSREIPERVIRQVAVARHFAAPAGFGHDLIQGLIRAARPTGRDVPGTASPLTEPAPASRAPSLVKAS